jgi:uncharacterized membrane protein YGL010W
MSAKKSADAWFAEYGVTHQHHTRELIHWVCVPVIFTSVLGFISMIPVPESWSDRLPWFNWTHVAMLVATAFYVRLSPALSAGLLFFMSLCHSLIVLLDIVVPGRVWQISAVVFVAAWIGQFIGQKIEGKKPSLFEEVVFVLIGPAWLMSLVYTKIGQKY